jgi:lipoprotein-anchoring transpeptidase ErfK/SrfK
LTGAILAVLVAAGVVLVALGGAAFAAYRYDQSTADLILPGVSVAGVDLGGMTRSEAIAAIEQVAAQRLDAPLTVTAGPRSWTITPRELGQTADVSAAVDRALDASRDVGFLSRVWHRMRQEPVGVSIDLRYGSGSSAVQDLVGRAADDLHVDARDAAVLYRDGHAVFRHSRRGRDLGRNVATHRILQALADGSTSVKLPVKVVRPDVPDSKLGKTIIVDRTVNELYFYDGFDLQHTYPVATAADGYVTPAGEWTVVNKVENPTWYNPAPDTWGADLPMSIPPGPGNPLGTRAIYLDAPGIRIHGTYDVNSIGTHASHGCIRMLMSDVEALYPLVPIGTRVVVV